MLLLILYEGLFELRLVLETDFLEVSLEFRVLVLELTNHVQVVLE